MKIGDKLEFGAYGVSNDNPHPIIWLKGTPNGDFITQDAVDYLAFDGRERTSEGFGARNYGNANYSLSNILLFLNSEDSDWWHPTHQYDAPPGGYDIYDSRVGYANHFGFLYHFEDYEVKTIVHHDHTVNEGAFQTLVRLPSYEDVLGAERFKLFSKKGVRIHGTSDFVCNRGARLGFEAGSFIDFWVSPGGRPHDEDFATIVSRSGLSKKQYPYHGSGIRPVCTLNLGSVVELGEDGVFRLKPSEEDRKTFTDDEFLALLGMARP